MSRNQPDPDANSSTDLSCEEARRRTKEFALGDLAPLEVRELRHHILGCAACRLIYREAIEATAALAHVSSEEREHNEIEREKRRLHAERFGPTEELVKHRRYYRLRIALIPAFFIILMIKVTGLGEAPARVDIVQTEGTVRLENKQVVIAEDPLLVLPGRWVRTESFSKAKLDGKTAQVELAPHTDLLLEAARPVRMRLRRGQVDVEGDLVLYSVLGMLRVTQGKGRLSLGEDGLSIEAETGQWTFLDKAGERSISLGVAHLIPSQVLAAK